MPSVGADWLKSSSLLCACGESKLGKTVSFGSLCYLCCLGLASLPVWSLSPQPRDKRPSISMVTGPWWQLSPQLRAVQTTWSLEDRAGGQCPYLLKPYQ